MKLALRMAQSMMLVGAFATCLSAHTISIGFANSGPGSVTFWYGSYHSTVGFNEGSLNLVGVNGNPFPSTTVSFTNLAYSQPPGLIDGVTNFYTDGDSTGLFGSDVDDLGPVASWQGVAFSGLSAGDYVFTYVPIDNPTNEWRPWGASVLSNTVTLSEQIITGSDTPEPATFALMGSTLLGLAFLRKRKR